MGIDATLKFDKTELHKFLDSNDNNPNFGMALEEAVDTHLITQEEAERIVQTSADALQWNGMLSDGVRNKKLQDFLKVNRWMRRQGFKDFEAMEELEKKKRLKLLEQDQRKIQDEV